MPIKELSFSIFPFFFLLINSFIYVTINYIYVNILFDYLIIEINF